MGGLSRNVQDPATKNANGRGLFTVANQTKSSLVT